MLRLIRRAFLFKIRCEYSMSSDNAFLYIVQRKVPSRCQTRDIYLADGIQVRQTLIAPLS